MWITPSVRDRVDRARRVATHEVRIRLAGVRDVVTRALHRVPATGPLLRSLWCEFSVHQPLRIVPRGRTVALFSHFDRDGRVDAHVLYHLEALANAGVAVVFVSTAPRLGPDELMRLERSCVAVIRRDNRGLDFGSWRTALLLYPELAESELLLLVNDSVYGPLHDLGGILRRMRDSGCDFWGITESLQIQPHYQSYFLGFGPRALRSRAFQRFWDGVRLLDDKDEIIAQYEIGMRAALASSGLRGCALVPAARGQTNTENPTLHRWRDVVLEGSPYVKVQLLRDNPHQQPIDDWRDLLQARGFPVDLVTNHLARTKPRLTPSASGR